MRRSTLVSLIAAAVTATAAAAAALAQPEDRPRDPRDAELLVFDQADLTELTLARAQYDSIGGMGEAYYAFDHGNVHFICLDSEGSSRAPGGAMLTWLQSDLLATGQDWIVAFWHHPPYTKGTHDSDNPADSGGRMRDMRENALPILEAGGVEGLIYVTFPVAGVVLATKRPRNPLGWLMLAIGAFFLSPGAAYARYASLTRDGIGKRSILGRVSGYQPYPEVIPGDKPGQWYVSWRGFEAGHLEAFVARTQCKTDKP